MWAPYLHHITVHFPIALSIALAAIGLYSLGRESRSLDTILRWGGWVTCAAALVAVVSGIISAPGWFGGDGSVGLTHHRDLALTAFSVIALAAYSYEKYAGGGHPDWRRFAVGLWCVAAIAVIGAAHWGGSELHTDKVPWLEQKEK